MVNYRYRMLTDMMKRYLSILCSAVLGCLFVSLFIGNAAYAQSASSPAFLITWRAVTSSVPPSYTGKALPTDGSQISASLELISQGSLANLNKATVYWYLNDALIDGGTGKQHIVFTLPSDVASPALAELRVTIPNYGGATLLRAVEIPVVQPHLVIYAPYPNGQFSTNTATVDALPYFFNAPFSSLVFTWSANGQSTSNNENPSEAQIVLPQGTPDGTSINVSLNAQNPLDGTTIMSSKTLIYRSAL